MLPASSANRSEPAHDTVHVAGTTGRIVRGIGRLEAHDMAGTQECVGERPGEVPVAPARRDLARRSGDGDRDAKAGVGEWRSFS